MLFYAILYIWPYHMNILYSYFIVMNWQRCAPLYRSVVTARPREGFYVQISKYALTALFSNAITVVSDYNRIQNNDF